MRKRILLVMLFPITVLLWLVGWILFWTGSQLRQNKSDENQTSVKEEVMEIAKPEWNEITHNS